MLREWVLDTSDVQVERSNLRGQHFVPFIKK